MVWTPPQNGRQSMAEEDLPVEGEEEDCNNHGSDGVREKQKNGRRYGRYISRLGMDNYMYLVGLVVSVSDC